MRYPWNRDRSLLRDDLSLSVLLVEFVDEFVFAGFQRIDRQRRLLAGGNHLFLLELAALELHRRLAFIADLEPETLARRHFDRRRLERAIARRELVQRIVGKGRRRA